MTTVTRGKWRLNMDSLCRGCCACHWELKFSSSYDFSLEKLVPPSTSSLNAVGPLWPLHLILSFCHPLPICLQSLTMTSKVLPAPCIPPASHGHLRNKLQFHPTKHILLSPGHPYHAEIVHVQVIWDRFAASSNYRWSVSLWLLFSIFPELSILSTLSLPTSPYIFTGIWHILPASCLIINKLHILG